MKTFFITIILLFFTLSGFAAQKNIKETLKIPSNYSTDQKVIWQAYSTTKGQNFSTLESKVRQAGAKSLKVLLDIMKNDDFSDQSRWHATFMVGKLMGKKSIKLLSKYANHPNWLLRIASLKVLQALKARELKGLYVRLLEDKSYLVRKQALENIAALEIKELAPFVWKMLYDKRNYKKNPRSENDIVTLAISTIGHLKFQKAQKPLMTMLNDKRYASIGETIHFALGKITNKIPPQTKSLQAMRRYWKSESVKNMVIN